MISKIERQQIKSIIQDPRWRTIENVVNELCDTIKNESVVRDTEWETLTSVLINEGQIRGIRRFIQELFNTASQAE